MTEIGAATDGRAKFAPELFAELEYRAHVARVDRATAELVTAFREHGIPSILLKGPATARVLYPNELRLYNDVDLLVTPSQFDAASEVAEELGFARRTPVPSGRIKRVVQGGLEGQERALHRDLDRVTLDLHRSFHGLSVDFDLCSYLAESTDTLVISRQDIPVPKPSIVALLVSLHAANSQLPAENEKRLLDDLNRCLQNLSEDNWAEAADHARRLGVADVLVSVLQESGADLGSAVFRRHFQGQKPNRLVSAHLRNGSVTASVLWWTTTFSWRRRVLWVLRQMPRMLSPNKSLRRATGQDPTHSFWRDLRKLLTPRAK
jgi:Uncharacterised nucleotidyltransferase